MKNFLYVTTICLCLCTTSAFSAEYDCVVDKKVTSGANYSAQEIRVAAFKVKISDKSEGSSVSRCSYSPSEQKSTCDEYPIDKVAYDENLEIKKFYLFNSQFDVQLFRNMTFIENNGRGSVAYGKCTIITP